MSWLTGGSRIYQGADHGERVERQPGGLGQSPSGVQGQSSEPLVWVRGAAFRLFSYNKAKSLYLN